MKKNLVLLIALAFMGSSLSIPAFAAVKSGAVCKNQGQVKTVSGYKYTCKKTGNKLVWIKGVKVSAKPTKPSVSTQTPTERVAPEPIFGAASITSNGFTVPILNHDNHWNRWDVTVSPIGSVRFNYKNNVNSGFITGVTVDLAPSTLCTLATVKVTVSCAGCTSTSATFSATSLPRTKTLLETQLSKAFKSELVRDLPFTLVVENPNLSQKNRFLIEEFKKHLRWLSGIGANEKRPFHVIYADTADWMNDEFKRQGCEFTPGHRLPLGGYAVMADCAGKVLITRPNADREVHESSIEAQNGLIHEAFHLWQNQLVRGASEYGRLWGLKGEDWPKWVVEGGAHAFSRYAFWYTNGAKTSPEQIMKDWFKETPSLTRDCVGVTIRDMVKNISNGEKGGLCPYSTGQVAIDLYIERFGVDSFYALFRSPKSPGYGDFPGIFRTVTGQEVEAFYDEVDKEMKLRGWS